MNNNALRPPVESGQYTSLRYTDRLDELGIAPSVGSVGDAYDNAMAEAWVATYKSELVDGRLYPSFEHAEQAALSWIGFYNTQRLHEALGDIPPAEYEALHPGVALTGDALCGDLSPCQQPGKAITQTESPVSNSTLPDAHLFDYKETTKNSLQ
jgi:putative transposase